MIRKKKGHTGATSDRDQLTKDDIRDFLLREYEYFGDSFWNSEEQGEKRVAAFFAIAGLLVTAIGFLVHEGRYGEAVLPIVLAAVVLLLFGRVTFVRLIKRNLDTDGYKEGMAMVRAWFAERDPSLEPYLYYHPRHPTEARSVSALGLGNGGWLETVLIVNSLLGGMATGIAAFVITTVVWNTPDISWISAIAAGLLCAFGYGVWQKRDARERYTRQRPKVLRRSGGPLRGVPDLESRVQKPPREYFRAGVGAVILSRAGLVLSLERSDVGGAWQLPQGGLEKGEKPEEAVYREIEEETGLARKSLRLVGRLPELTAYELPNAARSSKTGRGQVQYWFYFLIVSHEDAIRLPERGEFQQWRWVNFDRLLSDSVDFRRPVYTRLKHHYMNVLMPSL